MQNVEKDDTKGLIDMKRFEKIFNDDLVFRVEDDERDNYNALCAEMKLPIERYEYSDDALHAVENLKLRLNEQIATLIQMRDYLESPQLHADLKESGLHE